MFLFKKHEVGSTLSSTGWYPNGSFGGDNDTMFEPTDRNLGSWYDQYTTSSEANVTHALLNFQIGNR